MPNYYILTPSNFEDEKSNLDNKCFVYYVALKKPIKWGRNAKKTTIIYIGLSRGQQARRIKNWFGDPLSHSAAWFMAYWFEELFGYQLVESTGYSDDFDNKERRDWWNRNVLERDLISVTAVECNSEKDATRNEAEVLHNFISDFGTTPLLNSQIPRRDRYTTRSLRHDIWFPWR